MSLIKTTLGLALALGMALPILAEETAKPADKPAKSHSKTVAKADPATEAMMKKSDCFTCHTVTKKLVGPAYKDVAKKYKNDPKALEMLTAKVKAGGAGHWGQIPMSAHPNLKDADIKAMVQWVLAQK